MLLYEKRGCLKKAASFLRLISKKNNRTKGPLFSLLGRFNESVFVYLRHRNRVNDSKETYF